jgi:flagellar assembly factor FliW
MTTARSRKRTKASPRRRRERASAAPPQASGKQAIRFQSERFGEIEVPPEALLEFPRGLIGFPAARRFAVVENPGGGPFRWLHSVDEPGLAFVVADPDQFFVDFAIDVPDEERRFLELEDTRDASFLVVVVVPADPRATTANLLGPIVINSRRRRGLQLELQVPGFSTRQPVFVTLEGESAPALAELAAH